MNIDAILDSMNQQQVECILIGGVNYLLRHEPVLTFDIDFYVENSTSNKSKLNAALIEMGAQWGAREEDWDHVPKDSSWLNLSNIFCLTTKYGAVDIFFLVPGLDGGYRTIEARAIHSETATGVSYKGLSDLDMLNCQLALEPQYQKAERIRKLKDILGLHD